MINISFNQECPDLIEFFNSNQLKELIENIELDKQLQTDYQCNFLAYQVCVMLDRLDEAKIELNKYLEARPNLKTKDDFRKLFFRSSPLTDIVVEVLCMADWEPEES